MRPLVLVLALSALACGEGGGIGSTTAATTTSTVAAPSTTRLTSTTVAPSTTRVPSGPSQVTGLAVGLGGGSLEVAVTWDHHPDADHFRVYFSQLPGGDKVLVRTVAPTETIGSQVGFIDHPRNQTEGETCYVVTAVDSDGVEGEPSLEACFYS